MCTLTQTLTQTAVFELPLNFAIPSDLASLSPVQLVLVQFNPLCASAAEAAEASALFLRLAREAKDVRQAVPAPQTRGIVSKVGDSASSRAASPAEQAAPVSPPEGRPPPPHVESPASLTADSSAAPPSALAPTVVRPPAAPSAPTEATAGASPHPAPAPLPVTAAPSTPHPLAHLPLDHCVITCEGSSSVTRASFELWVEDKALVVVARSRNRLFNIDAAQMRRFTCALILGTTCMLLTSPSAPADHPPLIQDGARGSKGRGAIVVRLAQLNVPGRRPFPSPVIRLEAERLRESDPAFQVLRAKVRDWASKFGFEVTRCAAFVLRVLGFADEELDQV